MQFGFMRGPSLVKNFNRSLVIGCSALALASCGADDLGSPGSNGDINIGDIINTPAPTPTPTGPAPGTRVAAADCPTLAGGVTLLNNGTTASPNGSFRVCTLPNQISASTTLPYDPGVAYELNGRVDVGIDGGPTADSSDGIAGTSATLTIEPGVVVYGREGVSGGSYLIVNRGSKLNANGTPARPIIFTAATDIAGAAQEDTSARWGGIVLLGRAPVADCFAGGINQADQLGCQMRVEGIANNVPFFGGNTPTDSSGSLTYLQIRYSGFTLDLGSELQSLTLGGIGSGTTLDYIQSFNSSDDGTEFFGGNVNMKHFVAVGAEDDSVDTDSGVQANLQYLLVVQRDGVGDRAIENDSPPDDKGAGTTIPNALPRTLTQISNATLWGASGGDLINVRGASDLTIVNSVLYKPTAGKFCVNNNGNTGGGRGSQITFRSNELACTTNSATDAAVAAGANNVFQAQTLTDKYINGASEAAFAPVFDAIALSTFFDRTTYIGAVQQAGTPWTRGWTCDSATVSFGSGIACNALPVFN